MVAFVFLASAAVAALELNTSKPMVAILGFLCAIIFAVLWPGVRGIAGAVLAMAFTLLLLKQLDPTKTTGPGKKLILKTDADVLTPRLRDSVLVSGNVYSDLTGDALEGAFVNIVGLGRQIDTTDMVGGFDFNVPSFLIEQWNSAITVAVSTGRTTRFPKKLGDLPFELRIPANRAGRAATARSAEPQFSFASYSFGGSPAWTPADVRASFQDSVPMRFVLDSVVTLHDGSSGATRWRFDVYRGRSPVVNFAREYDDTQGKNRISIAREVRVLTPTGRTAWIQVQGIRNTLLGSRVAAGKRPVAWRQLMPEQPVQVAVPVAVEDDAKDGQFVFYFTVVRLGTPNVRAVPSPNGATRG